jgi:hypothetical protein
MHAATEVFMPRAYFEPEHFNALADVFCEAKRILKLRGVSEPAIFDAVAIRIFALASQGLPPWLILNEIMPPMTPEAAGLPDTSVVQEIRI